MHKSDLLKVGNTVNWRGDWGRNVPLPAIVTDISIKGGDSSVESVPWDLLTDREIEIDLDNGQWAYGEQLDPYEGD